MEHGGETRAFVGAFAVGRVIDAAQIDELFEAELAIVAQLQRDVGVVARLDDDRQLPKRLGDALEAVAKRRLEVRFKGLEFACHNWGGSGLMYGRWCWCGESSLATGLRRTPALPPSADNPAH